MPPGRFDYRTSPSRQWQLVALLTAIGALSTVDRQILALLVEPLKADLQLSDAQIGILQGAGIAVTGFIVGPIAGILADRICRRCMIGISAVLWSILTAFCGLSSSYGPLLFARAGIGLFEGVHLPTATSMLRDGLSVERRGRGFATMAMGNLGGVGLSMIVGGMLVAFFESSLFQTVPLVGEIKPWRLVFLCFGLIGVPVAFLMLITKEPMRGGPDKSGAVGTSLSETWRHIVKHRRIYLPLMLYSAMHGMLGLSFAALDSGNAAAHLGFEHSPNRPDLRAIDAFPVSSGIVACGSLDGSSQPAITGRLSSRWASGDNSRRYCGHLYADCTFPAAVLGFVRLPDVDKRNGLPGYERHTGHSHTFKGARQSCCAPGLGDRAECCSHRAFLGAGYRLVLFRTASAELCAEHFGRSI